MAIEYRPDDPIRPGEDVVLRAGGGSVDNLVERALQSAPDYEELLRAGHVNSVFTISVHVPRGELPTPADVLADPIYRRYGGVHLEAPSDAFDDLDFVQIVATTPITDREEPSALDLCHYDIVVVAANEVQLRARIEIVRGRFIRRQH